jgi:hypothetical protein
MDIFFSLKIGAILLGLFLIVLVPVFLGRLYGLYHIKKSPDLQNAPVGTVVAAAFGTMAFLLAFIFQITANRYADRKELLLDEVTNIRKTYLQAGLLSDPMRSDTRKLLVEYTNVRAGIGRDTSKLDFAINRSQVILDTLWSFAEKLAAQDRSSEVYALFTTSINDLVDNYNQRITMTFEYRLPNAILWILSLVSVFSMFSLGYQFGITGRGSLKINIVLAMVYTVIMFLIISLDRPEAGLARLDQKPLLTLQKQLNVMQSSGKY